MERGWVKGVHHQHLWDSNKSLKLVENLHYCIFQSGTSYSYSYLRACHLWDKITSGNNQHYSTHAPLQETSTASISSPPAGTATYLFACRPNSIPSNARKKPTQRPTSTKRDKKKGTSKQNCPEAKQEIKIWIRREKKTRRYSLKYRKIEGEKKALRAQERNVVLKQIPNLGSDSLHHLPKAVAICIPVWGRRTEKRSQMAAWPWCTLLLHNPDPRRHWERNKTPIKLQPIPLMGLPQICPINTAQARVQFLYFEKGQKVVIAHVVQTSPLQ